MKPRKLLVVSMVGTALFLFGCAGTIPADMAALVDQLPANQQFTARMLLKGATTFRSDHPLSDLLAGLYGLSEEQKLDLFRVASQL